MSRALELLGRRGAERAVAVTLVVTSGGHLTETGLRREFEALTAGTPLEGARLRFRWQTVRYRCSDCLRSFRSVEYVERVRCQSCGGTALPLGPVGAVILHSVEIARPASGTNLPLRPVGPRR
jgi:Zn finger protein HypA/HybF involved in hydrogenase expression